MSFFLTLKIAPYPGDSILTSQTFNSSTFETEKKVSNTTVLEQMEKEQWVRPLFTDVEIGTADAISSEKKLQLNVHEVRSDELNNQSRKLRDMLFGALGYHCVL